MTIIEAASSGKAFRRKSYNWIISWIIPTNAEHFEFTLDDVLADDWEIIEDSIPYIVGADK